MKYASNLLNGNWLLGIKMRLNPQFQRPRLWSKQRDMSHDLRMADNRLNNLAASLWSLDFRNSEIFDTEKTLQRCHFLTTRVLYRLPVKTVYQVCLLSCKYISQTFTCFIFSIFWVRFSQVPRPTCFWKWVGATVCLYRGNFTLRHSSGEICARIIKNAILLDCSMYQEAPGWVS